MGSASVRPGTLLMPRPHMGKPGIFKVTDQAYVHSIIYGEALDFMAQSGDASRTLIVFEDRTWECGELLRHYISGFDKSQSSITFASTRASDTWLKWKDRLLRCYTAIDVIPPLYQRFGRLPSIFWVAKP